jgi:hypothetical protein
VNETVIGFSSSLQSKTPLAVRQKLLFAMLRLLLVFEKTTDLLHREVVQKI